MTLIQECPYDRNLGVSLRPESRTVPTTLIQECPYNHINSCVLSHSLQTVILVPRMLVAFSEKAFTFCILALL